MDDLKGKKLLVLGATASEISLVKRAQDLGIYVVVTDNNLNHITSPAKDVANEYWDISWSDIDVLEKKCKKNNINGVTAGYSEIRIEALIKLCSKLDLPCYCTLEQLDITRDKIRFKDLCKKYNIPVVKQYENIGDVNRFPVIIKPVDRAGSIGIRIATNKKELNEAYEYALEKSIAKKVIIEDFIENGIKFDVYYSIENGKITELSTCDTINAQNNKYEKLIQTAWLYPSKYVNLFYDKIDKNFKKLIRGMKINYGCITFSGFVSNNNFYFFECGFRLEGAHQYEYVKRRGIYDYNDLFIIHALTGNTKLLKSKDIINDRLKCVDINVYAKKGIVNEINGIPEIKNMKDCSLMLLRSYIGQECDDSQSILTKIVQFAFCNENVQNLKQDIIDAYSNISILDQNGEDMIYDYFDSETIMKWWD